MTGTKPGDDIESGKTRPAWLFASLGEALLVGAVVLLVVSLAVYGVWFEAERTAMQNKRTELMRLASSLTSLIDTDTLDKFRDESQTNTPEFEAAVAPLRRAFQATPGIKFLYTVRLEGGQIKFVLDATMPGDSDQDGVEDQSKVGEVYENSDPGLNEALLSGTKPRATASDKPYTDAWGTFISGFAPYLHKDGTVAGVLGVDVDARDFMADQARRRSQALNGLIPAAGFALLLVIVTFAVRLKQRRLQALSEKEFRLNVRLAEIARRTASAVIVTSISRRIEWVNEGFVRMTGYLPAEVEGLTAGDVLFGDRTDRTLIEGVARAMDEVSRTECELILRRKDNRDFHAKIEVEPVFDAVGRHTGFMAVMSDVTSERLLQAQLTESEQQLQATFNSMAEGVVLRTSDGIIRHVNPAAYEILGLTKSQMLGAGLSSTPSVLTRPDGSELPPAEFPSAISLATGQPVSGFLAGVQRPDGKSAWIRISTEPVYDANGEIHGVVSSFADVTDFETAQRRLATERARLREFVAHAPAAIAMLDADLVYVAASDQWCDLLGLDQNAVGCQKLFSAGHRTPASWEEAFSKCLTGEVTTCEDELWEPSPTSGERHIHWISRPWHLDDGSIGGVLVSAVDTTEQVQREEAIRTQAAMLLEMNKKLDELATRDPLTNLVNRRRFVEIVSSTVGTNDGSPTALLYLDLDNFKYINDAMGHDAGDTLLKTVAERLTLACDGGAVARLGGDEFAVFLFDTDKDRASEIATQIVELVKAPVELDGRMVSTSFSVGVAPSRGRTSVETLLQQADMAMYYAKSEGKSCWKVYEDWMSEETVARLQLEADMRQAWDKREFQVYYQPLVAAESGDRVSAEALVRWRHERRGIIGPDKFIPLLEEIGLIEPVGFWVMETACRVTQDLRWTSNPDLRVAVNVSGQQLKGVEFVPKVLRILEETGLPAEALTLEITETVLVSGLDTNRAKLDALRMRGVKIAVDDFGTGYSSMGILTTLPVDIVKIDKSFVMAIGDSLEASAIMRALITLTKVLGLQTVAEGVETENQFVQLHALGIDYCQGYYFSPPLEVPRYKKWVYGSDKAA